MPGPTLREEPRVKGFIYALAAREKFFDFAPVKTGDSCAGANSIEFYSVAYRGV